MSEHLQTRPETTISAVVSRRVKTSTAAETQHQRPANDLGSGCRAGQAATALTRTRAISTGGRGRQRTGSGVLPDATSSKRSYVPT